MMEHRYPWSSLRFRVNGETVSGEEAYPLNDYMNDRDRIENMIAMVSEQPVRSTTPP
jgi:hypothetical protein